MKEHSRWFKNFERQSLQLRTRQEAGEVLSAANSYARHTFDFRIVSEKRCEAMNSRPQDCPELYIAAMNPD